MATQVVSTGGSSASCFSICNSNRSQQVFPHHHGGDRNLNQSEQDEMRQTEDLLASEMNKLTVQERSKVLDDVHCVGEELHETPEMVEKSLAEFEVVVQKEKTQVYDMAHKMNPTYVENPAFRLQFLRATMHEVVPAVRKMMNLLKCKAMYFGDDTVARDITLDDLNEEDMELMLSGLYHIQNGRDRSGRVIVYLFNDMLGRCRADVCNRVAYYVWMHVLVPIPEVQMKGTVAIYYDCARPGVRISAPSFQFLMGIIELCNCMPVRNSASHLCMKTGMGNASINDAILEFLLKGAQNYDRVRASLHLGSDMEIQYHLRSRGIPIDTLPVDKDGNFHEDVLNAWFYNHRDGVTMNMELSNEFEDRDAEDCAMGFDDADNQANGLAFAVGNDFDATAAFSHPSIMQGSSEHAEDLDVRIKEMVNDTNDKPSVQAVDNDTTSAPGQPSTQPTDVDVLFGRGKRIQFHPGNVQFREFVANYSSDYDTASRKEKVSLVTHLVLVLRAKGVRFFQQSGTEGVWFESDIKDAEKKVSQALREERKKKKRR